MFFSFSAFAEKLKIFVSIPPQVYFVEQIAGDQAEAESIIPPGACPETFCPSAGLMARLSEASVYFKIGMPFEDSMLRKTGEFKNLRVVDTIMFIKRRLFSCHSHGHEHEISNGAFDPHVWMSPLLVIQQALVIKQALCSIDPENSGIYEANYAAFATRLYSLNDKLKKMFEIHKDAAFYVFHPSYGYFADQYGLRQVAIEEDGREPGARSLAEVIEKAATDGMRVIFYEPRGSRKTVDVIAAETGAVAIPLDPLEKDYISNMEYIASEIEKSLVRRK